MILIRVFIIFHSLFARFADLIALKLETRNYQNPELSFLADRVPDIVLQSKAPNTS
jgi:hypothetical protein